MAEQLVIYLKDTRSLSADWVFTSQSGEVSSPMGSGLIAELVEKNKNSIATVKNITCIISAELVHLSFQNIPAKNKQRALQAIPFLLEEQLAEDIELLHFATGTAKNNIYPVAAIKHDIIQSILSQLSEFNIKPTALYADISCLPQTENNWNLLSYRDRISIDQHRDSIINTDHEFFPLILGNLLKNTSEDQLPGTLTIWSATDEELSLPDNIPENINVTRHAYDTSPISHFLHTGDNKSLVNLLQGTYKVVSHTNHWWKVWRNAAVLAIVVVSLQLISGVIQLDKINTEIALLDREIIKIYKKSFPRSKRIVNPRVQMENSLKQLRKGSNKETSSFTDLLMSVSPVLQSTSGLAIQDINFNNNKLELTFSIDKLSSVESLKTSLNQLQNIKAELISSSSSAKQVNAKISIEAP